MGSDRQHEPGISARARTCHHKRRREGSDWQREPGVSARALTEPNSYWDAGSRRRRSTPPPVAYGQYPSALGNAGEAQAFHISLPVARLFDGIGQSELFDSEIGLKGEKLPNVELRFVAPA